MIAYIVRRLVLVIPMVLGITLMTFSVMQLAPGKFTDAMRMQPDLKTEYIDAMDESYGLNKPWPYQYAIWLGKIVRLDFGQSWTFHMPVADLLWTRVPNTLALALSSLLLSWIVAVPLGVLTAMYKDSIFDRVSGLLAYVGISMPSFFLALMAVWLAARTGWFPIGGTQTDLPELLTPTGRVMDYLHHLILPTLVLTLGGISGMMRIMRSTVLDTIRADYVTTARAKGVPEGWVMFRHVLRNSINPLVTSLGFAISGLLSGALMVENVMNYPGLGNLVYQAFLKKEQFVVLAAVTVAAVMLIIGNLVADILLSIVDPRIRLGH